jgi:hypothetical protein
MAHQFGANCLASLSVSKCNLHHHQLGIARPRSQHGKSLSSPAPKPKVKVLPSGFIPGIFPPNWHKTRRIPGIYSEFDGLRCNFAMSSSFHKTLPHSTGFQWRMLGAVGFSSMSPQRG